MSVSLLFGPDGAERVLEALRAQQHLVWHGPRARLRALLGAFLDVESEELIRNHPGPALVQGVGQVSAVEAARRYRRGAIVRLDDGEFHYPAIGRLLRGAVRDFGLPPTRPFADCCRIYLTSAGRSFGMHFDHSETMTLQLRGKKRWVVAPNVEAPWPTAGNIGGEVESAELKRIRGRPFPSRMPRTAQAVDLRPGSALFLPRGHWHRTKTSPAGESLSLSFGVYAPPWADLVLDRLRQILVSDPRWREPSTGAWGSPGASAAARARLDELLATPVGPLDAREIIEGFGFWRAAFGGFGGNGAAMSFAKPPSTTLTVARDNLEEGGWVLQILTPRGGSELPITVAQVPFCRWLARRGSAFGPPDALGAGHPLATGEVVELLELLVRYRAVAVR